MSKPEEEHQQPKFLKKAERKICWDAKDDYWKCKDRGEGEEICLQLREVFKQKCPVTWVNHFDRKYEYEKFKAQMKKDGYEIIDHKNNKENNSSAS